MATEQLKMPRLGETMEEGRLVAWLKAPGETFTRGEVLAEVETDKTVVELPALSDGRLVQTLVHAGEDVAVDAPIAEIEVADENAGQADASDAIGGQQPNNVALDATHRPVEVDITGDAATATEPLVESAAPPERVRATPLARRLARRQGIALETVAGTGRRGRIEAADILERAATGASASAAAGTAGEAAGAAPTASATSHAGRAGTVGDGTPRMFEIFGGSLACAVHGTPEDPPLLLIHGFSGFSGSWAGFPARLAGRGRFVAVPDLPAHGDTTLPADTPEDLAAPLPDLLATLGLPPDRVEIVGHSLGGVVATRLAESLVARGTPPRRLTLLGPAGMGREIDRSFIRAMASGPTAGALAHLLRKVAVREPDLSADALEARAASLRGGRLKALAALLAHRSGQGMDIVASLRRLAPQLPTRIGFGVKDAIIPWTHVAHAPPAVAVHLFEDAGHMIHWDAPEALAALLAPEGDGPLRNG